MAPTNPQTQENGFLTGEPNPNGQPPTGGYDYGKAQASWFNAAPGTSIDQWVAANPGFTQGITSSHNGEWMNLPGGESFDAQRNFGPGQSPQWGSQNYDYNTGKAYTPQEAQAAEAQWASQHPGGGGSTTSSTTQTSSSGAPAPAGVSADLYNMLLSRAHQGTQIGANDSNIKQQSDPYNAQVERDKRNYLSDAAEGLGPTVNMQGLSRVASEHAGQAKGNFQATLVGKEIDARRTEIQSALTQLQGLLTSDQQMAMQKELTQLNIAAQKYSVDAQTGVANNQLGLQYSQFDWDRDPSNPHNIPNFNSNN